VEHSSSRSHLIASLVSLLAASCGDSGGSQRDVFPIDPQAGAGAGAGTAPLVGGTGALAGGGAPIAGTAGTVATSSGGTMAVDSPVDAGDPGGPVDAGLGDAAGADDAATEPGGDPPAAGTVEDSGSGCGIPELPNAAQLAAFDKHHDPFTMLDGTRITSKAQWRCRRAEIKAQVEKYESGPKPVVEPENVSAQWSGNRLSITGLLAADIHTASSRRSSGAFSRPT
jgi:hypothetical protein